MFVFALMTLKLLAFLQLIPAIAELGYKLIDINPCVIYSHVNFYFQASGKVTHNLTLQTATHSSAVASEKEAYVTLFEAAKNTFNLRSVTTDGNVSIRAFMARQDEVKHGLDVWHLCKNLSKNLAKKARSAVSK